MAELFKDAKKMIEIITAVRIHNNIAAEVKSSLGYNLRLKRKDDMMKERLIFVCGGCVYSDQYLPDSPICKKCAAEQRAMRASENVAKELHQLNENTKKMIETLEKLEKALNKNSGRR